MHLLNFFRQVSKFPASALSGGVVMTLALYISECLVQYHIDVMLIKISMVSIVLVWAYGSFSLSRNFLFSEILEKQSYRYGLSAWIACTALTGIMVGKIMPLWHGMLLLLMIFSCVLWLKYVYRICLALLGYFRSQFQEYVNPLLLLGSVATASNAWLLYFVFQNKIPAIIYQILIVVACLLYLFIILMLLSNYAQRSTKKLFFGWSAANSLIFSAPAIIGMASLVVRGVGESFVAVLWDWSAIMCVIITILEVIHLSMRGYSLVYDVRHWLRPFGYMMFYVFTWYCYFERYVDNVFAKGVAENGLSIITALVLMQVVYECAALWSMTNDGSHRVE